MRLRRTATIDELIALEQKNSAFGAGGFGDAWIEHELAVKLGKKHGIPLIELLRGTSVFFDAKQPPPPPKTPEYLELMKRLKLEEQERQYQAMIQGTSSSSGYPSAKAITKEVNEQVTTIFNVLVSVFAVAWAFWYWCSSWQIGNRILISLFAGAFICVVEVSLLAGYNRRVSETKARRADRTDSRRVVSEIVFEKGTRLENKVMGSGLKDVTCENESPTCEKAAPRGGETQGAVLRSRRIST